MYNPFISTSFNETKSKLTDFIDFIKGIMNFYAVAKGRNPGIYMTWDECKAQVHQFSGPVYKKFYSKFEAENFIKQNSNTPTNYRQTSSKVKNSLSSIKKIDSLGKINLYQQDALSSKRLLSTTSNSDDHELKNVNFKQRKMYETNESSILQNEDQFILDENGFTEVYTDGACTFNGRGNAKAGIGIWFSDNNSLNVSRPVIGRATNNMAEIQAVTVAAKQAQKAGIKKLKINTDSQFLISCITQWMPKWKRCGWLTSNNKDVINKVELIEMEKALSPLTVTWNHVRGHIGIHGNEMADKFARNGTECYKRA